ncbi:MAG: hypothetical protein JW801_02780 [Bacteroidales bacterium]|nr:hypothetical protein [Bacteroidales bacterium]
MKLLLKVLYLLSILVILILLAGLFLPDYHSMKTRLDVKSKPELIYNQIVQIEKWKEWAPWLTEDKGVDVRVGKIKEGAGSSLSWTSREYGAGSITLTSCTENEEVRGRMDLGRFGKASFKITLTKKNKGTLVNYEVIFSQIGYFERYFVYLFSDKLTNDYLGGLKKIRTEGESLRLCRMSEPGFEEHGKLMLIAVVDTFREGFLEDRFKPNLEKIEAYLSRRKLAHVGEPLAIFFRTHGENNSLFATAYPIEKRTWSWKEYQYMEIDTGRVAAIIQWGELNRSEPYKKLDEFIRDNKLVADTFWWETYERSSLNEADTGEWKRKISIPILEE